MHKKIDVIVLGLSPTGLYAVREAARAGYAVLGVGAPGALGLWSRFLLERIIADTPEARVAAVIKRAKVYNAGGTKPLLIVTSDQDLEAVTAEAVLLSRYVHLQGSYQDGLARKIMDKDKFYRLCEAQGVMFPSLWTADVKHATQYRDQVTYPLMIKPARIHDVKHLMSGRKGWIVKNPDDFKNTLFKIPEETGKIIIQEIVPGPESNISLWCGYFDQDGKIRQRFTARKLRQYPPGFGSASLVQSDVLPETAEKAEHLLSQLNYKGIAAAEFKRDERTGDLKIIEINPRPSLWFSITTKSGIRIIETCISEAQGKPLRPFSEQKSGVIWRYTTKDLASKTYYMFPRKSVLPAPDVKTKLQVTGRAQVVSSYDDPLPGLMELAGFAVKTLSRAMPLRDIFKRRPKHSG